MSATGTPPRFIRFAWQPGAMFRRTGSTLAAILEPLDEPNNSIVGFHGTNYWQVSPYTPVSVVLREYHDDGADLHPMHQVKPATDSALQAAANYLALGLLVADMGGVVWNGDTYHARNKLFGFDVTGRIEVRKGRVQRAHVALGGAKSSGHTYRVDYAYDSASLPHGIPSAYTNIVIKAGEPNFIGYVVKIVELSTRSEPEDWAAFTPERHLGTVHVKRLRETRAGVEVLADSGDWRALARGHEAHEANQMNKGRRGLFVIIVIGILLGPLLFFRRATQLTRTIEP